MASSDWTVLGNALGPSTVLRAVTNGTTLPNGGGLFAHGFASADASVGVSGLYVNLANFSPTAKGGRVTGCVKRGLSGGPLGFSPLFFFCLQGTDVADSGYLLGLSDGDPAHITLRKGALTGGLPDSLPGVSSGVLRRSTVTVGVDVWAHLRLDVVVNDNGDVRLQVFRSDLAVNPLSGPPDWQAVAGMDEFVDDALGVNSGSLPYTSGRAGFAFQTAAVTRRAYFDHVEILRQL